MPLLRSRRAAVPLLAPLALAAGGCDGDDVILLPPRQTYVLTPQTIALAAGDSTAVTVTSPDVRGRVTIRVRSLAPGVASADSTATLGAPIRVRAHGAGTAALELTMTADGQTVAATIPVTVARPGAGLTRDTAAAFQTDSLHYTLRATSSGWEARIGFVFTNPTAAPAYVVNCGGATGVTLEKLVDGAWRAGWHAIIPMCLSAPITIAPGARWEPSLYVFGGYPGGNTVPRFEAPDPTGVYRAVWHSVLRTYQDRLPFGDPLPLAQRTSNRFTLTAAPR